MRIVAPPVTTVSVGRGVTTATNGLAPALLQITTHRLETAMGEQITLLQEFQALKAMRPPKTEWELGYDAAWDVAMDLVRRRAITNTESERQSLGTPMPDRTAGALQVLAIELAKELQIYCNDPAHAKQLTELRSLGNDSNNGENK